MGQGNLRRKDRLLLDDISEVRRNPMPKITVKKKYRKKKGGSKGTKKKK